MTTLIYTRRQNPYEVRSINSGLVAKAFGTMVTGSCETDLIAKLERLENYAREKAQTTLRYGA